VAGNGHCNFPGTMLPAVYCSNVTRRSRH